MRHRAQLSWLGFAATCFQQKVSKFAAAFERGALFTLGNLSQQTVPARILGSDIEAGIKDNSIWPAFQPIVDIRAGTVTGFEVLARWSHQTLGSVSPTDFIPVAEKFGLIDALTDHLISVACRQAVSSPNEFTLNFNMSAIQFRDPQLFNRTIATIKSTGFPVSRVHIEVTESALIEDTDTTRSTMAAFRAAGMGLALDDFGTGFASLTQLHSFPFDTIKIDSSFVRTMETDSNSRKIVASVIGLGQSLGLSVVAEGVETDRQSAILEHMGCDYGQGWRYGRPECFSVASTTIQRLGEADPQSFRNKLSLFQRVHQLEALYESAPIGLCMLGIDLIHLSANPRFAEMMKLRPEQMIGRRVSDFFEPGEAARIEGLLKRVLQGEKSELNEFIAPNGKTFIVINERINDDAGEAVGVSVTAIDITEHKTYERIIKENEEQFRKSLSLRPSVMWGADQYGRLTYISPTEESDVSCLEERVERWKDRMHGEDRERVHREWMSNLPTAEPFSTRFRLRTKGANYRWVSSRALASIDQNGRAVRWYGVINDISEQIELERLLCLAQAGRHAELATS